MTRKSRREIESAVDDLAPASDADPFGEYDALIAYRTAEGWVDADGEPLPEDADVVLGYSGVTVERATAEANGWEILGPATIDGAPAEEYVTVAWDYGDREGPQ